MSNKPETEYKHEDNVLVLMRKRDGQLGEFFPTCLGGYAWAWDILLDEPFSDDTPLIFDDSDEWNPLDYEFLGSLK